MKNMKNILSALFLFSLIVGTDFNAISAQTNANLQTNSILKGGDTSPTMVKLVDVLKSFKTKFDTDVLFEDKSIEGLVVSSDIINPKESVEVNLNNLLSSFSLSFKKVKDKTYVIVSKKTKKSTSTSITNPFKVELETPTEITTTATRSAPNDVVITGVVRDEKNAFLPGVTIMEKGKANTVVSKNDGSFLIKVSSTSSVLVFSYVDYQTQEVFVGTNVTLNISLKAGVKELDQIVVVGYGTQKKKDITGAVSSISKDRLADLPNSNFEQALQGAMPGVSVSTTSASAEGSGNSILVRGKNSIHAGTEPLIILDGIPFTGSMSEINPNDLESIDVLKDASSAAIYGAKASGGVIILTTKQGKKGKVLITYDFQLGQSQAAATPNLMNGQEFYNFKINRINPSANITPAEQAVYNSKSWINWEDLALRKGMRAQHSISISGATEKTKFYFNASYLSVEGIAKGDQFKRYSLRSNVDYKLASWISLASNTSLSIIDRSGIPIDFAGTSKYSGSVQATFFNPLTTPFNADGSLTVSAYPYDSLYGNPLSPTLASNNDMTYKMFTGNSVTVNVPYIKGLTYKFNTGVELSNSVAKTFYGVNTYYGLNNGGAAIDYSMIHRNFTIENIINYNKEFGVHSIGVTALYSAQSEDENVAQFTGTHFGAAVLNSNGTYLDWTAASNIVSAAANDTTTFKKNTLSQMIRLNYGYDSRYLLTFTVRRDGFSAFGTNQKYGVFPAIAVGWNIKKEHFMQDVDFINVLKFRTSYGMNGNSNITAYTALNNLVNRPYLSGSGIALQGFVPSVLGNDKLGWESSKVFDLGLDYTLLNQRISGSIDYYNKSSNNLILKRSISSVQGFTSVKENIGKVDNKGIELNLSALVIKQKDFSWSASGNIAYNDNKILDLYGDGKSDTANKWFVGKPIDVAFGYKYAGIFQIGDKGMNEYAGAQPGYVKIATVGNDTVLTANDRQVIGNLQPKLIWGISNTIKYKNWSLYVFVRGVGNVIKEDALQYDNVNSDVSKNTTVKTWWTPTNHSTTHWANDGNANPSSYAVKVYENASFARLQDVTLSYELSQNIINKLDISRVKLYISGRNLALISSFKGIDPELNSQFSIPNQREFVIGLNIGF